MTEKSTQSDKDINLTINGVVITVPKGTTVYHAAQKIAVDIPIFCYQDRMPPFGACRMCLVEVEKSSKLQTSCTLEATEGMVVNTQSEKAVKGREDILEFLLINHPLDCPICDRGGECPLQEQTYHHGPGISRFFEEKRHFKKALPLGPNLMLDRERCIICARCTRFSDIIAGDHALEFKERGYKSEVGTPDNQPLNSKFIGNTIMICPVGALTSQVYRFRARPWDNDSTTSTCTLCPVGCSMFFDSRDGELMRTRSAENKNVNDIWMCDKGYFGHEFVSSEERLKKPLIRINGRLEESDWDQALSLIASKISEFKENKLLAGWGGNPLTTEENYLFQSFFRKAIGVDHVDHAIDLTFTNNKKNLLGMQMPIGNCESLKKALLLGLDITEEFPVIWLRLNQGINHGAKVYFAGHFLPEVAPHLKEAIAHAPGNEIEVIQKLLKNLLDVTEEEPAAIFIGSQYLNHPLRDQILNLLIDFTENKPNIHLNIMEGNDNSLGAQFAGMLPDNGLGFNAVFEQISTSGWDYLHIAGSNPAALYSSKDWKKIRQNTKFIVVQDLFMTETASDADVVLPTLSYVEKEGHFINIEGRIQKLLPGKEIPETLFSDAEIFEQIARKLNVQLNIPLEFIKSLHNEKIELARITKNAHINITLPSPTNNQLLASFTKKLFDDGVRMSQNLHLHDLATQSFVRISVEDAKKFNIQNDDKIKLTVNNQSIIGKVKIDKKVSIGTIVIPMGFKELPINEWSVKLMNGLLIEIERI